MSHDLYRLIPEEGKHLAESRDTEGAYRGVYLDNKTNKPSGAGEFIKVEDNDNENDFSENGVDNSVATIAGLIAVGIGIGVAATKAYPYVREWIDNTAVPGVKNIWNKIRKKDTVIPVITDESVLLTIDVASAQDFSNNVDEVLNAYQENMSSEEAQAHLLNIMCCAMYMANEIRKLSNVVIKNEKINREYLLEWKLSMEKLTTQTVTDNINRILESDVLSMKETEIELITILMGDSLIADGVFVPIKNEEIKKALRLTD